jgi:hypothetical protein
MYIRIEENLSKQNTAIIIGHQQKININQTGLVKIKRRTTPIIAVPSAKQFRNISREISIRGTSKSSDLIANLVQILFLFLFIFN